MFIETAAATSPCHDGAVDACSLHQAEQRLFGVNVCGRGGAVLRVEVGAKIVSGEKLCADGKSGRTRPLPEAGLRSFNRLDLADDISE